jgi:4a-hydroxytetrahydrobiopterin dehydratase
VSPKDIPYTEAQIADQLKGLRGWRHEGGAIRRTYKTDGWPTTLMLVNAIGFYAEAADHHPDLQVSWGSVAVALNTHSAGGITAKDIELARQIEQEALVEAGPPFRPSDKFKRT